MSALPITMFASSASSTGVAMAIGGIVVVLVISAVFYVIGRGEDRDRAQARQDVQSEDPAAERHDAAPAADPLRSRLPASARRRRRR
jgi:hypothetical protein